MREKTWTVAQAKAKFSEVIEKARLSGPQTITTRWLAETDESQIFISVVTLAELRHGVERLAVGERRTQLEAWITETLPSRFQERVLPIDLETAHCWGRLVAMSQSLGRPIGSMDAFLAATASLHDLTLVLPVPHPSELE